MGARASGRRLLAAAMGTGLVAIAAAGCGSSDQSATAGATQAGATGTATATQATTTTTADAAPSVADARKPLTEFDGPTSSPGPVPPDKKIAVIYPIAAPLPERASAGTETAAKAVGWDARLINAQGTPEGYVNALEQAISSKVDGIVLVAMPVPLLQAQIRKAQAAGIPVVAILPSLPEGDAPPQEYGLTDWVSPSHDLQGKVLGEWVVQHAPKGAQVMRLTSPEFPDLQRESQAFADTVEAGGLEVVATIESPVTDILGGPKGVQRLAAAMRQHPEAKDMFILSESWAPIFLQAKKLTRSTDVTGLGSDGDVSVPLVKAGEHLVFMGPDSLSYGWYATDALIRAFNDKPAIGGYNVRSQLVDDESAQAIEGDGITAAYDYPAKWKALWGLQ